jgi:hypothetical protein
MRSCVGDREENPDLEYGTHLRHCRARDGAEEFCYAAGPAPEDPPGGRRRGIVDCSCTATSVPITRVSSSIAIRRIAEEASKDAQKKHAE